MRALDHELFDEQFHAAYAARDAYALALHDLGLTADRSDEIVAALNRPSSEISSIRAQLLKKDVISRRHRRSQVSTSAHVELHRAPPPRAAEYGGTRPAVDIRQSCARPRHAFPVSSGDEYAAGKPIGPSGDEDRRSTRA